MLEDASPKEGKSDILLNCETDVPTSCDGSLVLVSVCEELLSPVSKQIYLASGRKVVGVYGLGKQRWSVIPHLNPPSQLMHLFCRLMVFL